MHILLLDCDLDDDERNTARMIARDVPARHKVEIFRACEGKFPESLTPYDAIIINGSAANVDERQAWIQQLEEAARRAHATATPMLGICFGAQLIAQALGGEVMKMEATEFGYVPVVLQEHPLFVGVAQEPVVFQYHSYAIAKLPPKAVLLGANDAAIQAFALGSTLGLQFHPEVLPTAARGMAQRNGKDVASLEEQIALRERHPELFVRNFLRNAKRA